MKLVFAVILTMCAFAGNSILSRIGVATYGMDPFVFSVIRILSGAVALVALISLRGGGLALNAKRGWGAMALAAYVLSFSWAYLTLDAGLGALILFGVLQIGMFGFAIYRGDLIPRLRWIGAALALAGLSVLLWPTGSDPIDLAGAAAMVFSGLAWAVYTLLGQGEQDALQASAGNFLLCVPIVALGLLVSWAPANTEGVLIAVLSGAVTSGMGYALWYRVLPKLSTTIAAICQLSVPVIAVAVGVAFLGEALTGRLVLSCLLVLGGIGLSLIPRRPIQ